ncbi:Hypothetical protein SMAX5B_012748 [Scophthalmus maximus]|uniref:Uncharacterized protein n=1 Tax=Scophthalmus maximus TaxID=52904 RepID=A0A2U9C0E4_SCOMX|nr:Hypothetical protein SMAX5B_012748 [Scophthalmus maximus]
MAAVCSGPSNKEPSSPPPHRCRAQRRSDAAAPGRPDSASTLAVRRFDSSVRPARHVSSARVTDVYLWDHTVLACYRLIDRRSTANDQSVQVVFMREERPVLVSLVSLVSLLPCDRELNILGVGTKTKPHLEVLRKHNRHVSPFYGPRTDESILK